jgi:hypothetical protein
VGPLARLPLHPLLLAVYAVLFVYAGNIDEVLPGDMVGPLVTATLAVWLVLGVGLLLYRDSRRSAVLTTALVLTFAFFGHAAELIDDEVVSEALQLMLWAGFVIAVGLYAWRARESLAPVTAALNAFGLALIVISLATIVPAETARVARASEGEDISNSATITASRRPERDIYFLVFDRYGSDWSLEERFGIDNDLYPDLEAAGFQVIPGARSNYYASDFSLAATLDMRLHDDIAESIDGPSTDRAPVRERLARHEVGQFLRANGYRYYHLGAWWEPTRSSPIADEVLALGKTKEFDDVLRGTTILPALGRLAGSDQEDTHSRDQHRDQALFAFRQVQRLADVPERKFVFAHILMPHTPYVLAEDGRVVFEAEAREKSEAELFAQQLDFTNQQINEIVAKLQDGPDDEDPIIIITADEGPYLCYEVDCVDGSPEVYGIRLGTLRAYYLPGLEYEAPPDDSGVNIFRMILREYFGADLPDLPNRSFGWPDYKNDLYTFTDVTDELPLPVE